MVNMMASMQRERENELQFQEMEIKRQQHETLKKRIKNAGLNGTFDDRSDFLDSE